MYVGVCELNILLLVGHCHFAIVIICFGPMFDMYVYSKFIITWEGISLISTCGMILFVILT